MSIAGKHPGTITIVDMAQGLSRVVSADSLPLEARFAHTDTGSKIPIVTILDLGDGRVATYGPDRKLIQVTMKVQDPRAPE